MWLKLKSGKDTIFLADTELSAKHKVFAVPGLDFSSSGKSGPYFRLSFGLLPRELFEEVSQTKCNKTSFFLIYVCMCAYLLLFLLG